MHRKWDWPVWAMIGGCALVVVAVAWWAIFGATLPDPLFGTELQCLVSSRGKCTAAKAAASAAGVWFPYEPIVFWLGLAIILVGVIARPLAFVAAVDTLNEKVGVVCNWLVLLACIVSGGNAMIRYAYDQSSNAWLEVQWYMFAVIVMFGAAYTLKRNEHVRVDLLYMTLGRRGQLWIDILGTLVFLLPTCIILAWLSWPFFMQAYAVGEHSSNAGGLLRWPIKLVLPIGFFLVALQGISEVIKRVAFLNGVPVESLEAHYERPTQ
jgi:TRAP-type mannitol/chloroaromatic compound transport system permease small subunit